MGGLIAAPTAAAQGGSNPAQAGAWSAPFEEGGAAQPRCETRESDGLLDCKPAAVPTTMLPNGKFLYWMGIEGQPNTERNAAAEHFAAEDSESRLLDLTSGTPEFSTPENPTGSNGVNLNIQEGRTSDDCLVEEPFGVAGVPGRPGDGFTGSLAGAAGIPEQEPACSPDDVAEDDTDFFCADVSTLADGRPIVIGGTDWYNEAAILEKNEGDPETVGAVELEGIRNARIYDYDTNSWAATGSMKYGRWYPGTITLPDGRVFATGGTRTLIKSTQLSQVRRSETYDPATGEWTENFTGPASENTLPQNPRLFLTPNGKVFYTGSGQMWGPFGQAIDEALFGVQQFFNLESQEWEAAGAVDSPQLPRGHPAADEGAV